MIPFIMLIGVPIALVAGFFLLPRDGVGRYALALAGALIAIAWIDWLTPPDFLGSTDTLERQFSTIPLVIVSIGWAGVSVARASGRRSALLLGALVLGCGLGAVGWATGLI